MAISIGPESFGNLPSQDLGFGNNNNPLIPAGQYLGGLDPFKGGTRGGGGVLSPFLGTAGGAGGTGFQGPQLPSGLIQPVNAGDIANLQAGVTTGQGNQAALLGALQGQGGLGAQSQLLAALQGQQGLLGGVQGQAVANQAGAMGALQGLSNQYQDIALGQGPNPAQAMLAQATGQNVANQAALAAGQRGAGANIGMLQRNAALSGAGAQQQAAGQAATMEAQQRLAALGQIGQNQQAIAGIGSGLTGQYGQAAGQTAGMANQISGQQIGQTNQNVATALANQGQSFGAVGNYNAAQVGAQGSVNAANAALANTALKQKGDLYGGLMSQGLSQLFPSAGQAVGKAHGGVVGYAGGGDVYAPQIQGASSMFGNFLNSMHEPVQQAQATPINLDSGELGHGALYNALAQKRGPMRDLSGLFGGGSGSGATEGMAGLTEGTEAAGMGEAASVGGASGSAGGLGPAALMFVASKGGKVDLRKGGNVKAKSKAQKAVAAGDSYANDKIDAKLSEGEIVLPRSVTMSGDPVKGAADFVAKVLAKRGR